MHHALDSGESFSKVGHHLISDPVFRSKARNTMGKASTQTRGREEQQSASRITSDTVPWGPGPGPLPFVPFFADSFLTESVFPRVGANNPAVAREDLTDFQGELFRNSIKSWGVTLRPAPHLITHFIEFNELYHCEACRRVDLGSFSLSQFSLLLCWPHGKRTCQNQLTIRARGSGEGDAHHTSFRYQPSSSDIQR